MKYLLILITVLTGCAAFDQTSSSDLKPIKKVAVASYGQTNEAYAESKPTIFDDKLVYFDGRNIRTANVGSLINYETLDNFNLRNKPEYYSATQALAVTDENQLVSLDVNTQSLEFVMSLKGPVLSSPSYVGVDKIFVQFLDSTAQYIDLKTREVLWERSLPNITSNYYVGYFKPLFDNDKIYFSIPGGLFLAVNKSDGVTVWTYTSQIASSSSTLNIADFLSPKATVFQGKNNIVLMNSDGYMHCISKITGLSRWVRLTGSLQLESNGHQIFTIDSNNNFVAFDDSIEDPLWKIYLGNNIVSEFVIVDNNIWLMFEKELWTVSLDGDILNKYQHDTKSPHLIYSLGKDKILLGDDNKYVYSFLS